MSSFTTTFERSFILHQPQTLKCLAANYFALHVIMITDCLQLQFTSLKPEIQHLIVPHLHEKWFTQFINLVGPPLTRIEKVMDAVDKTKTNTLTFLYIFFSNLPVYSEVFTFKSLMAECYISEKCNTLNCLPAKLFHLGIREKLKVMSFEILDPCCQYFSSCSINFKPTLEPLAAIAKFNKFNNEVYANYKPFIEQTLATNWLPYEEIPRRMSWAHYYFAHDRLPETLVQILCCLTVMSKDKTSRLDYLDAVSLLILVAAKLHLNIKCQSYIVLSALSLISLSFEIYELVPGIITMFGELGNFEWCKTIFYKFPMTNRHSRYYSQSLYAYADSLIEYIENICMSIIGYEEYHKKCKTSNCDKKETLIKRFQEYRALLSELTLVIDDMIPSSETDLFKAQHTLLKAFLFKMENVDNECCSCIQKAFCLVDQILENDRTNVITKTTAYIISLILKNRGPLVFRERIIDQLVELSKSNISNLKGKIMFKSIIYFFLFYQSKFETMGARTLLSRYVDDALDIFFSISNKQHYRIRLLKSFERVFCHKMIHNTCGTIVNFEKEKLKITKYRSFLMCQYLFPNFPRLANVSSRDILRMPWTPTQTFILDPDKLIDLDPFIKNHIAFGTRQLQVKDIV